MNVDKLRVLYGQREQAATRLAKLETRRALLAEHIRSAKDEVALWEKRIAEMLNGQPIPEAAIVKIPRTPLA